MAKVQTPDNKLTDCLVEVVELFGEVEVYDLTDLDEAVDDGRQEFAVRLLAAGESVIGETDGD